MLGNGQLMRLNFGVFSLHLMQTAMWVLVPAGLVHAGLPIAEHWKVYLPAVLLSFVVMVPAVIVAEKKGAMGAMLFLAESFVAPVTATAGFMAQITILGGLVAAGVSFYGLLLDLSGVLNWGEAISNLRDGRLRD